MAFDLALSGRPGPVLLDVPMDIQRADVTPDAISKSAGPEPPVLDVGRVDDLLAALSSAKRPLILVGGGIRSARANELFKAFVERVKAPVVHSLMAVDALPYGHPSCVGLIGSYGNRWANLAIGRSDFLLVLGSRLDVRQTGADTDAFQRDRTIYHVDCEASEINNRVTGCQPILAHLRPFLEEANRKADSCAFLDHAEWFSEIRELREAWPDTAELAGTPGVNPNRLMHQISSASGRASAFVIDVGQHQMWAAQSLELGPAQRFLTSGGMGAMGFALPAAVGVAFAEPNKPVLAIAGDGGFQLNIQELETIAHHQLPIKMIVLDNQCLGMVRQFQQSYFDERYQATLWGYSAPDFVRVAQAYGIAACTVDAPEQVPAGLEQMWRDPQSPFLLRVIVDTCANAYPKIAFGHPMTEMEPFAKPLDMEGT